MRLFLLLIMLMSAPAFAECSAQSGDQTVPLIELYTSEGCSSCPPADEWLSGFKGSKKIVPLAFHVDYWDYIGWKDRFASPQFSARQRRAASLNGATFVYTPQIMLNGRDFRGWRNTAGFEKTIAALSRPSAVRLNMQLRRLSDSSYRLEAAAQAVQRVQAADIYIALYENNLSSRVSTGENSGRELKHDYVVRELLGPYRLPENGRWQQTIPLSAQWKSKEGGTAMFVQHHRGQVLQALGLAFCH
jgi:hypothetical protein